MTQYLGFEDEVVIGYIEGQLTGGKVDPKLMQLNLQGFLEKHTTSFMKELWTLLISAQARAWRQTPSQPPCGAASRGACAAVRGEAVPWRRRGTHAAAIVVVVVVGG